MTVSTVCNPNVATIDRDEDAQKAAILMRQEHVGDLVVTQFADGHIRPVGIITDRDIVVGIVAKGIQASDVKVGDTLRGNLVTVRDTNGIGFALQAMRRAGVRRVPVVDADDALVGVLSIDDVIDHLAEQLNDIAATIGFEQDRETKTRP